MKRVKLYRIDPDHSDPQVLAATFFFRNGRVVGTGDAKLVRHVLNEKYVLGGKAISAKSDKEEFLRRMCQIFDGMVLRASRYE